MERAAAPKAKCNPSIDVNSEVKPYSTEPRATKSCAAELHVVEPCTNALQAVELSAAGLCVAELCAIGQAVELSAAELCVAELCAIGLRAIELCLWATKLAAKLFSAIVLRAALLRAALLCMGECDAAPPKR